MNLNQDPSGTSIEEDLGQYAKQLEVKNQELEAELSSTRQKILQIESLPQPEPIIIFKEMGSKEAKSEQGKDKATSTENDAVLAQTMDGSAANRAPRDQIKEDDTQVSSLG